MRTAPGLTNATDLIDKSDLTSGYQAGYAWYRDWRLWTAALSTLFAKAVFIALVATAWQQQAWLQQASADLLRWRDFFHDLQSNRVPYVDMPSPFLPLAGLVYWLMAHSMNLESVVSIQLVHATCMAIIDAANAALLYSLARDENPPYALPATLLVSLSSVSLVFGPLYIDGFVVSSLLIGYRLHSRGRPLAASAIWSLGCAIKWFPFTLFLIQEIRALVVQRRRKQWLPSTATFVGLQLAIYLPLLVAAWVRHNNLDNWIDSSFAQTKHWLSPVSLLGMAQLVAGRVRFEQYATYWSLALVALAIVLKPKQPLAFKVVLVGIATLLINRTYPRELQLCFYPFLMLVILQVESRRGLYLLAAYVLLDLISTQVYPFAFVDALAEMQQIRPRQAFRAGHGWTAYWSLCIVLRTAALLAIAVELWRGVEDNAFSTLRFERRWADWRARLSTQNIFTCLAVVAIVAQCFWVRAAIIGLGRYSDEGYHLSQIGAFCDGRFEIVEGLTMLPGYHAVSALFGKFARDCGPHAMRSFNMGWGLAVAMLAFLILRSMRSESPLSRTIGLHFLPILYPYYFVVFTDVLGLVLVLLTTLFIVQQRWNSASVAAIAAILVRQPNAVMLLLIAAIAWLEAEPHQNFWTSFRQYLARTWVCWLGVVGFCLFILVNGGVAVGDHGAHQPGLHTANIYFTLFLLAVVALPVIVETLWKRRECLASPLFMAALLAVYLLYMQTFEVTHPYNGHMNFIRNSLLSWAVKNNLSKSLFFLPMAMAFACVWTMPLQRRAFWTLVPLVCALLIPEALIEQRYAILPISLWMLLRRDASQVAEGLNACMNAVLATTAVMWIANGASI